MAVRMTVLASGSRGNSTVLSSSGTSILVDAGLSCRETLKRMVKAGEDPLALKGIIVTHEHQDHVNGLPVLARKLRIPVYMTQPTHHAWKKWVRSYRRPTAKAAAASQDATLLKGVAANIQASADKTAPASEHGYSHIEQLELFDSGKSFQIGDIGVQPFRIPHDAADPVGFVFTVEGMRIGYATDIGYMSANMIEHLRRCDGLLIESNHDKEMLRNGPYPWSVKQRVMSRVGHLANDDLATFFESDYDGGAAFIVLAHLSENNNHPELARTCAERVLEKRRNLLHPNTLKLAFQDQPLETIQL